jgi:hypothetical protein
MGLKVIPAQAGIHDSQRDGFPRRRESMTVNEMDPRIRGDDTTLVIHEFDEQTVIPAHAGIHFMPKIALASSC